MVKTHRTETRVGITGQAGFIGYHIYNTLSLSGNEQFRLIPFEDDFFKSREDLEAFVTSCDIIIHLAAMNRHDDPQIIYETNVMLVEELIGAMERTKSTPHIIFASSIQETLENAYGLSKREGRSLLKKWALKNRSSLSSVIIPNVYGPFCQPNYNSVVATFCYKLIHNETPEIHKDGELRLIYVHELVESILAICRNNQNDGNINQYDIPHTFEISVSNLLTLLKSIWDDYSGNGEFPNLDDTFIRNLFNTLLTYIDYDSYFPVMLKKHTDSRGSFSEMAKLNSSGQLSFSTTSPGITRGNHYHTRKAERFIVIKGTAQIKIRKIGEENSQTFILRGDEPAYVDMPVWHTHNIKNVGHEELYTIFWINEHYDPDDSDTYYEEV